MSASAAFIRLFKMVVVISCHLVSIDPQLSDSSNSLPLSSAVGLDSETPLGSVGFSGLFKGLYHLPTKLKKKDVCMCVEEERYMHVY